MPGSLVPEQGRLFLGPGEADAEVILGWRVSVPRVRQGCG